MPALDTLPDGSNILIDANVFIYALSNRSAQCKALLERCAREQIYGITLYEVIHDATHRFMCAEAIAKGLTPKQPARYLSDRPDKVKGLVDYWINTQRILALNLVLLPMEEKIMIGAQAERVNTGMLTNDSLIVSSMHEYDISMIATNDRIFNAVNGLSVFTPTDV